MRAEIAVMLLISSSMPPGVSSIDWNGKTALVNVHQFLWSCNFRTRGSNMLTVPGLICGIAITLRKGCGSNGAS